MPSQTFHTRDRGLLRGIVRSDKAGSAAFIALALLAAPAVWATGSPRSLFVLLGIAIIAYAVWLAALGVLMAWGMTRAARRGVDLPDRWWESLVGATPAPSSGQASSGQADGEDASRRL